MYLHYTEYSLYDAPSARCMLWTVNQAASSYNRIRSIVILEPLRKLKYVLD